MRRAEERGHGDGLTPVAAQCLAGVVVLAARVRRAAIAVALIIGAVVCVAAAGHGI